MLRHESTAVRILFAPFVVLVLAAPFSSAPALANLLDRPRDPVVMTGAQLPGLVGARPDLIVGFRREGSWVRIPVQVDERANVDFTTIYHVTFYDFLIPSGYKVLTYTDPSTWTGPDPNPAFDDDDELVFMAREAGDQRARGSQPAGTVPGSGVEVTVTNPLNGRVGYVYLFRSDDREAAFRRALEVGEGGQSGGEEETRRRARWVETRLATGVWVAGRGPTR